MDTLLLVKLSGETYERLDIFEDIPITLTIQQNDLTDLAKRRVPYSKTIQIPDTSNNAILLEHYYEINGIEFNPLTKLPCIVQYRGLDIFSGVMRLNSVIENADTRIYEIFILGDVADFVSPFRDLDLQDLNYTDLNHQQVYSAITLSWENKNDGASGLFNGQIVYPLINYGLEYIGTGTGATPTFTYDFEGPQSFDQPQHAVPEKFFKPAIQLKSILNRIFDTTEYQIESEFFETEYFKAMYIDTFQNGKIGVEEVSAITNQNIFKVYQPNRTIKYDKNTTHQLNWAEFFNSYDPLNNFRTINGHSVFLCPYNGQYGFNVKFNLQTEDPCIQLSLFSPDVVLQAWKGTDVDNIIGGGTMFYESPLLDLRQAFLTGGIGPGPLPVNLFFDDILTSGEFVELAIVDKTNFVSVCISSNRGQYLILPYKDSVIEEPFVSWELYESPIITNSLVDMSIGVPNIGCFEFFKSLIILFNLVIWQDENNKKIRIEPYNWYYNDSDRTVRDWTNKLDLQGERIIEPLNFELAKDIVWTGKYAENEYLPKLFFDRFDFVYGRRKFTTESNIFTGQQIYEVPFGPCPTSGVTNAPNFIIPQFYYNNNNQQAPYAVIPHLFFWVGNRFAYKDVFKSDQGHWYMFSGSTAVEWNTYPCVSHLSFIDSQIPEVISDLNFEATFDFFGNTNTQIAQFTNFTLYNSYWRSYIENLYSSQSKRLTGNFFMKPIEYYDLRLNDKIFVHDSFFTIERINDANLVNRDLTKISLIKESSPYYKIEPPAPVYFIDPNESYPTPQPFFFVLCYLSTDKDQVCNSTTPTLTTVYSFGGPNLQNFDQCYIDIGTSFQLVPMGTYLRETTSTTTFVVVNIYGNILETTC